MALPNNHKSLLWDTLPELWHSVLKIETSIMYNLESDTEVYRQLKKAIHLSSATIEIKSSRYSKPPIYSITTMDSDFLNITDKKFYFWCRGCGEKEILDMKKPFLLNGSFLMGY
ncbi:MAG TPA: hypothetical protein PLQ41_08235 [bacterium]|nr:hypothetical protein [bacterium]